MGWDWELERQRGGGEDYGEDGEEWLTVTQDCISRVYPKDNFHPSDPVPHSVGVEIRVEINCGGKGFLVTGNIGDREKKELVALWDDLLGGKNSWEMIFWRRIRR